MRSEAATEGPLPERTTEDDAVAGNQPLVFPGVSWLLILADGTSEVVRCTGADVCGGIVFWGAGEGLLDVGDG